FAPASEVRGSWTTRLYLLAMAIAGAAAWIYFLGFGRAAFDFHDWADITIPRLTFLQDAVRGGQLPLQMERSNALHGVTGRFLAIPDVVTTPQVLLLRMLSVPSFVLIDVVLQYGLGVLALLAVRRYFDWSLSAFTAAFLLIMFNGHILAHYSVGHFTWGSYFLFPLIALILFRCIDGDTSWRLLAGFAATIFYMMLAGGEHHVTWVLLLMALLIPFCWPRARWLAAAAVAAVLLSAVRFLPPSLELQSFADTGLFTDVTGYPSLWHLLIGLVSLRREIGLPHSELPANLVWFDTRYWEFNLYVGAVGLALIAGGVYLWLRQAQPRYRQLIVPLFAVAALSMGSLYRLARWTGVPLLQGERASSRMMALVLVFLVILAVTHLDAWLRDAFGKTGLTRAHSVAVAALVFLGIDISASIRLQRVAISSGMFGSSPFNPAKLVQVSDPIYERVLLAGLLITIVTAGWLAFRVWRESQSARTA
ncbi:MAG TPA: hypothetical protein VK955_14885, partial [Xanthobacteraceae bacterium]|nr:hypothetical protein [Xanthobacteraceae bacterium]